MLTLALVGLTAAASYAQGTIQFLNSGLNAIQFKDTAASVARPAPLGCVVGVFWGTTPGDLHLQLPTAVIDTTAGVWNGGAVYALTGTQPGQTVSLKIAAWYNKDGPTPRDALGGINTPGISHYGESAVVTTLALGPTAGPGTVVWQGAAGTNPNRAKPFVIELIPEPSVVALGALGLGALLLIRRRKA